MIKRRKNQGLTLMELMIAMAIGLMLLGGAMTMFVNNKRVYKQVNEVGRLQENARFALEMMTRDIRMAGFNGCHHSISAVNNAIVGAATAGSLYDHSNGIEGIEGGATTWSPSAHAGAGNFGIAYSFPGDQARFTDSTIPDAITVRYLSGEFWDVVDDNDPGADAFETAGNPKDGQYMLANTDWAIVSTADDHPAVGDRANDFAPGELISITDCSSSDIFQLTEKCTSTNSTYGCGGGPNGRILRQDGAGDAIASPGNIASVPASSFTKVYQEGSKVRRYNAVRYYIGNGAYGGPSLFRQYPVLDADSGTTADDYTVTIETQELIEGVENMQLMYGVDTDNDGVPENYYVAGVAALDETSEWADVAAVKISLLLRTVDASFTAPDTKTYAMLGQNVDPANLPVRRRVFSSTIQLRNRISR